MRCIPPNPRRMGYIDPIHGPLFMGSNIHQHLARAPRTPRLVTRRYSKDLASLVVFKIGNKYKGISAAKTKDERTGQSE